MNDNLVEFFRQASFYRYHEKFDEFERLYKIRLANSFSDARQSLSSNPQQAVQLFRRALTSGDDNIINWRDQDPILKFSKTNPTGLIKSLEILWDEERDLEIRFSSFCETLRHINVIHTGSQLAVTSTLLMALSASKYPPVKTEPFIRAMKLAGWPVFERKQTAFQRYEQAVAFVDDIVEASSQFGVELRDRLDAQGVIWCVSGGWPKLPVPSTWVNDPAHRSRTDRMQYSLEMNELEAEPEASQLTETQKLILVKARRGQGAFREDLVKIWHCCSVTGCANLTFLRASHIRPWSISNNVERLDPYNGLLLTPNLDAAFDQGLITFDDEGRSRLSPELRPEDRKLLGIHGKLRLKKVSSRHIPYLTYHRENVFKRK